MRFRDFLLYSDQNTDDMPLYLFDKDFARKAPQLADDYEVKKTPSFISLTGRPPRGVAYMLGCSIPTVECGRLYDQL